jgi:hypothetical protein
MLVSISTSGNSSRKAVRYPGPCGGKLIDHLVFTPDKSLINTINPIGVSMEAIVAELMS